MPIFDEIIEAAMLRLRVCTVVTRQVQEFLRPAIAVFGIVFAGCALTSCLPSEEEQALRKLQTDGIPTTTASVFSALSSGDLQQLDLLMKVSVSLSGRDSNGRLLLTSAICVDNAPAISRLLPLTSREQLAVEDKYGLTALSYAIEKKQYELVETLIAHGAPAEARVSGGRQAIAVAVDEADIRMVKLLVGDIAAPNLLPDQLQEPLYSATKAGKREIAELLLNAGADPNYFSIVDDRSPLAASIESNNTQMANLLAENGAAMLCVLPAASVATGTISGGKILEPHLLNVAFDHENQALIRLLIDLNVPLDHPGKNGATPLARALENVDIDLVKLLLKHGAAPGNALFVAIERKDPDLIDLMLANGASLEGKNSVGDTPLHIAVDRNDIPLIKQLLESEPNLTVLGRHGQTAFAVASVMQNLPVMELLLKQGMDPNEGFAHQGLTDSFKQMVPSKNFLFYLKRDKGLTPIMLAAACGNLEMLELLLENGAKRFKTSRSYSRWPINFACDGEHIKCAQRLLGRSPDSSRNVHVVISLSNQKATLYKNGEVHMTSNVSSGMRGYRTPTGKFVVTNKARHHTSSIYGSPMPYFQRLSCQAFGFHVGHCPGYPASHGCIRMPQSKARAFFSTTKVGDPVEIIP